MGNYSNSFTPDLYLKHKEYFDGRLIQQLESDKVKISVLKDQIKIYQNTDRKNKSIMKALGSKKKDLEILCANLKQKVKDLDEQTKKIIKDLEKERVNHFFSGIYG